MSRLNSLNTELSSGLTAVAALIYKSRLYVANVGDCRALLCRTDENSVLRVLQLSVDHDLTNEDELLRLSLLGLNTEQLKNGKYVVQNINHHRIVRIKNNNSTLYDY